MSLVYTPSKRTCFPSGKGQVGKMQHNRPGIHATRKTTRKKSDRQPHHINSTLPRISPQHLKPLALPERLSRNIHPLRINNTQAPPTNRLEPLPPNLRQRHPTAPAFTLLLLKPLAHNLLDLLLITPRANPPSAIPLRRIRPLAPARFKPPVERAYQRRRNPRQAAVAVSVPTLRVLLR
jgi:hypothetical protein